MILLTDGEIEQAFRNHISDWALAGYDSRWGDDGIAKDTYGVIRKAQLKKDHDWLMQFKDDIETIGDFWTFTIPNHEIQALKKEAGG